MRADELVGWLAAAGVDGTGADGAAVAVGCAVGEEPERAWCVRAVPGDENGWEVFWCERGGRFEWTRFDDEAVACFALFGRLVWARLAAR